MSLINRSAVKKRFENEGFRTSAAILGRFDREIDKLIVQTVRGMGGMAWKTASLEALERGRYRHNPAEKPELPADAQAALDNAQELLDDLTGK